MKSVKASLFAILLVALFIISFFNNVNVNANEKSVVVLMLSENGESSPPILDMNDGYMYPGAEINKSFILKNTTPRVYKVENIGFKNFTIQDINGKILDVNNGSDLKLIEEFYESIQCSVRCDGIFNNEILYADDIKGLIKGKTLETKISILSGNEKNINVLLIMKTSAGINMQGLQANFNIVFNATSINDVAEVELPTPIEPQVITTTELPVIPPVDSTLETPVIVPTEPTPDISVIPDTVTVNPVTEINVSEDINTKTNESLVTVGKIVKTGSLIDTFTLSILGLIFIGAGAVITFKKS